MSPPASAKRPRRPQKNIPRERAPVGRRPSGRPRRGVRTPCDCGLERTLAFGKVAGAAAQDGQVTIKPVEHDAGREQARPRGGEFDGERQTVKTLTNRCDDVELGVIRNEVGRGCARPIDEELDSGDRTPSERVSSGAIRISCSARRRSGERLVASTTTLDTSSAGCRRPRRHRATVRVCQVRAVCRDRQLLDEHLRGRRPGSRGTASASIIASNARSMSRNGARETTRRLRRSAQRAVAPPRWPAGSCRLRPARPASTAAGRSRSMSSIAATLRHVRSGMSSATGGGRWAERRDRWGRRGPGDRTPPPGPAAAVSCRPRTPTGSSAPEPEVRGSGLGAGCRRAAGGGAAPVPRRSRPPAPAERHGRRRAPLSASTTIQSEHELAGEALTLRMGGEQRLQLPMSSSRRPAARSASMRAPPRTGAAPPGA